jgi:hypothetical protein
MAVIKLVEDYAVSQLRKDVRDAMMLAGEQSVLLSLYHAGDPDVTPCPECGDSVYRSPEVDCPSCYGTTFNGGVRLAMKVWAIYGDKEVAEQVGPRGVWQPDQRGVTFEAFPTITEHDVLARVRSWGAGGTVAVLEGFYRLQKVQRRSLRTGNRFGQYSWDVVSQKAQCTELNSDSEGIAHYPVLGQTFLESIQLQAATASTPADILVEPDVKVVYIPVPGGGGLSGNPVPDDAYVYTQASPAATWTILHNLGFNPTVTLMVDGEEVETDVDYPSINMVVITWGTPQVGTARLT